MQITHDEEFNKIISIPPVIANLNPAAFKHLHQKTLHDYYQLYNFDDFEIEYSSSGQAVGLVIIHTNLIIPNTIFQLSKKFNVKRFLEDESYASGCQFFYWEEKGLNITFEKTEIRPIPMIRFASPYIDFTHFEPAFKEPPPPDI